MSEYQKQAAQKLRQELKDGKYDQYAGIMKNAVNEALCEFCRQEEEFARAVLDGGNFDECMKAVARNVGKGISDLDAYKRAVQFYFPGSDVKFSMQILMSKYERETEAEQSNDAGEGLLIDLSRFL